MVLARIDVGCGLDLVSFTAMRMFIGFRDWFFGFRLFFVYKLHTGYFSSVNMLDKCKAKKSFTFLDWFTCCFISFLLTFGPVLKIFTPFFFRSYTCFLIFLTFTLIVALFSVKIIAITSPISPKFVSLFSFSFYILSTIIHYCFIS